MDNDLTGTLTIFDIDDTLFRTDARTLVMKDDVVLVKLDSFELEKHELDDDHYYSFEEFSSSKIFAETAKPIDHMIELAKKVVKSQNNPNSRAIIVTARSNMDDTELFLDTFRKHGLDIDNIYVERAGELKHIDSSPQRKKTIFRQHLLSGKYSKIRLYDDQIDNIHALLELKEQFPDVQFRAYRVLEDGELVKYER